MSNPVLPIIVPGTEERETEGPTGPRIRCPKCLWVPKKSDLWACTCGTTWHTFDTGGVCPGCMKQWSDTQCLLCQKWSAHSEWYEY